MERGARVSEKNNYQNNIKHFRVREGLTQEELAKKINTSRQMIGLIENSKTIPSVEIALKLAKVLYVVLFSCFCSRLLFRKKILTSLIA